MTDLQILAAMWIAYPIAATVTIVAARRVDRRRAFVREVEQYLQEVTE